MIIIAHFPTQRRAQCTLHKTSGSIEMRVRLNDKNGQLEHTQQITEFPKKVVCSDWKFQTIDNRQSRH